MEYKSELRNVDTQEKAYLLGFMFGDGTISHYAEKTGSIRHLTRISISVNDKKLIDDLYNQFPFFCYGEYDFKKHNSNSVKQVSISKSSKQLYDDLMLNGLYPRKSYENKDKLHLPDINDNLIPHFIRGFFDADGSIYIRAKRKNLISIEFCSVSLELLTDINSYLKSININSWKIITKQPKGNSKQVYYILSFIKTSEIQKLIDFMYKDATISLERKAKKCLEFKPVNKVLDRNLSCPRCNSTKVWNNGVRGKSTRFQCQNCSKGFSIKNYSK